jgi:alpha-tubulin suppressor-like RCC1 family protein
MPTSDRQTVRPSDRQTVRCRVSWQVALAVLLLGIGACDRPTAPTLYVYADRPIVAPTDARGWRAIAVGGAHSCAIRFDESLYCWGANESGQLGVGLARGKCGGRRPLPCENVPTAVASQRHFARVAAGQRHSCGITTDGALYCWGESLQFQTGVQGAAIVPTPQPVLPDIRFTDVSAGATHSCAVRTNGVVYCWGEGALGALGRGDTLSSVLPAPINSQERFILVSAGRLRTCAIALDASAWCWGAEWESNQSNLDFYHERLLPHRVDKLPPLRAVSVGSTSTCGVSLEGVALCWESNGFAQLGNGGLDGTATPTPVASSERFTGISAGIIQGCAAATDGRAFCWGNNSFGQLGVPRPGEHCGPAALECSHSPIGVFGMLRFVTVATGFGNHACGLSVDTAVLCWGLGNDGQLGDGYTRDRQSLPVGVHAPIF